MSPVAIATFTGGGLATAKTPASRVGLQAPGSPVRAGAGECVFATKRPPLILRCRLGPTAAKLKGGVGGWEDVTRPGRDDGIEWRSTPTRQLEIPLLLDGFVDRRPVDAELAALYVMGRPPPGTPRGTPPPVVEVAGTVPHGDRDWVLTAVEEGDAIWDGHHRIRQWVTVTLTELVDLDLVKVATKKSGATPSTRTYVVRNGETLGSIARDQMGARTSSAIAKAVASLKKLNGIRDPKSVRAGQKLKVPRS